MDGSELSEELTEAGNNFMDIAQDNIRAAEWSLTATFMRCDRSQLTVLRTSSQI